MGFHRMGVSVLGEALREGTVSSAGSTKQHLWETPIPSTLSGDPEPTLGTKFPVPEGTELASVGHAGVVGLCSNHSRLAPPTLLRGPSSEER